MHNAADILNNASDHPEQLPGLTLAFVGDAVYELYVRTMMLGKSVNAHTLNNACVKLVNNRTQSALYDHIEPVLNDLERGVLHRGRNAKGIVPKNAKAQDYRRATAVEAIVGYWYLIDDEARLKWVFETLWEMTEGADKHEQSR